MPTPDQQQRFFGDDITYKHNNNNNNNNNKKKNVFKAKVLEPFCIVDNKLKDREIFCTEYINQSMNFLFKTENVGKDYLFNGKDDGNEEEINDDGDFIVKKSHRKSLLNFLTAIHESFELFDSTWYLMINIIDRYLSKTNGKLLKKRRICQEFCDELKLLGCTALWIASKYHEIYTIAAKDFSCIKGNDFSENDVIKMEVDVIKTIDFELTVPTPLVFIERFYQFGCYYIENKFDQNNNNDDINKKKKKQKDILLSLMKYCGEICGSNYELSMNKPSKIGCAVFYYSCIGTGIFSWKQLKQDGFLKYLNNYQLKDVYKEIKTIHSIALSLHNDKTSRTYSKYSTISNHCVTKIPSKMYCKKQ